MGSVLLELVRPGPPDPYLRIGPEQLEALKSEVLNSNILMLLYSRLSEYLKVADSPGAAPELLSHFEPLYLKGIACSMRQEAVEREIVSLLEAHGIGAIVIRGNEIARDIYNNPNCRASSDIDILIRKSDAPAADEIMAGAGHKQNFQGPVLFNLARIHHASYCHSPSGTCIELHWNFGVPYFFNLTSEDIWKEITYEGPGSAKMSPEMILIMLLIHHHSHSFRELRILVDIAWGLHKFGKEIDPAHFSARLEKTGLVKTAFITRHQLQNLWKDKKEDMQSLSALEQGLRKTGGVRVRLLRSYFRPAIGRDYSSRIYGDKFIARFALDRWATALLSFFRTLLPAPVAIREFYGARGNRLMPLLYLKFIVWRIRVWAGL